MVHKIDSSQLLHIFEVKMSLTKLMELTDKVKEF
jgi:hypothetical protein